MNIKPFAELWLEAKDQQAALKAKRESLIKLIQSRENRLANLETTIGNQINDMRLSIHSIDAGLNDLENEKDVACLDMLATLEGES